MNASPEQIVALRVVARALEPLLGQVVFVGGMTTGLLVTDPGAADARPTTDVDVIVRVAFPHEYQTRLRQQLLDRGFREDTSEGTHTCRWVLQGIDGIKVDIVPLPGGQVAPSNQWYEHAVATASLVTLPPDDGGSISIRVISAPAFIATKLVAWRSRGGGDLLSADIEDIVAVVDGRAELLSEIEAEQSALREFVAGAVGSLLDAGLEAQLPHHLPGDAASQARLPLVRTTLARVARHPRIIQIGERVTTHSGGDPGGTGVPPGSRWDWEILGIERGTTSPAPHPRNSRVVILARLTSYHSVAGTTGDGRDVFLEDNRGHRFGPWQKGPGRPLGPLTAAAVSSTVRCEERRRRGMLMPENPFVPGSAFETTWVYEVPDGASGMRLLLPFGGFEWPFELP